MTARTYLPLISPNRGASVEDHLAASDLSMNQVTFHEAYKIRPETQIKLIKISFMRYQHPDLDVITTFLLNFGLSVVKKTDTEVWYRGYGADQYLYYACKGPRQFLGGAFDVESFEDLEKATKLQGVTILSDGIEEMKGAPGGGYIVTLADPEGFPISLVYGQTLGEAKPMPEKVIMNDEVDKPRARKFQRFQNGPAAVHKLGHYGLVVRDFMKQFSFYTQNFNLMPSNVLYMPTADSKPKEVGMFAHIERGEELVDHHTIFLTSLPPGATEPHVHHCSFEIHDLDSQKLGHYWLAKKGYEPVWGVGRHILGSQIFDYWWDPNHFMVEHYIDSDVVNQDTPVSFELAESAKDAAWGPDVPSAFLE
ncbi:trihydroxytoluene oxygenase [Talaromyces proteolyticus]|uniref:Trihydroxytoluene oxygenase n=1 Tax=Talaromyces proteolyticus TaxID=1131652 RepID=A0AAD4KMA1_9EURO|nr:trihydroxytoluene oxygenase [Talaromyces proteolyticus]KAH8692361.1 trihydroxytoluene oxygenase [Talaromyces proteolyticus]